ncbi:MAG: phosphoribosylanthranilate isomerase [Bryobacteraceae bacterium]
MIVKICGITNAEDARAAVEAGAGALGFNFYPGSPRYLSAAAAAAITERVPAGILKVGVFVNEAPARVAEIVRQAGLHVAQLHGDEGVDDLPEDVRVWKTFRVSEAFGLEQLESFPVEAFLLDTPTRMYGGSGNTFDWTRARGAAARIIVAGGLDESNVREAIAAAQPWGVDACSRLESAPGKKDHGRMARFTAAAHFL